MKFKDKTVLVVDHGIFLPIAQRLARDFGTVLYYSPWEKAFPTVRDCIGEGFKGITRVESMWGYDLDLAVFPDIGFGPEQTQMSELGVPVWGAGDNDGLEVHRGIFLDCLENETELPVPEYQRVVGLNDLRDHLKDKEDKWIKVSKYRGDWETLHWRNWEQDEITLDAFAVRLGPWKEEFEFYVFDSIPTEIEDGCDTYCIGGKFPTLTIRGMEAKDKAFIGAFQKQADLPEQLRNVLDEFGPILGGEYRSFFSIEVRVTEDGIGYFIDPTCRAGSPPSQVQTEMIANYSDIIWEGAHGNCIEPEPAAKFGVQALLSTKTDHRTQWCAVELGDDISRWVKCGFCSSIDGRLCVAPEHDASGNDIGWLVGIGDTMAESIRHLQHNIKLLPDGLCVDDYAIADLLKEVEKAEEAGMEFTEQTVPKPSIVLEKDA